MSMKTEQVIATYLQDPRFWSCYLGDGVGHIQDASSFNRIFGRSGLLAADYSDWWAEQRAGFCEDPIEIEVCRGAEVSLRLRLGEEFDFITVSGEHVCLFANIGGHWRLPGLRWEEYERIIDSTGLPIERRYAGLLLLPAVWLCNQAEQKRAEEILPGLFEGVVCDVDNSGTFAHEWAKAVDAMGLCEWRFIDNLWVTSSPESPRHRCVKGHAALGELLEQIV